MNERKNQKNLTNSLKKKIAIVFELFCLIILIMALCYLTSTSVSFYKKVDPASINGILTISGIIFGFSTLQVSKDQSDNSEFFSIVFLQLLSFIVVGTAYFSSYVTPGYPIILTLLIATSNLFVTLFSWFIILTLKIKVIKS